MGRQRMLIAFLSLGLLVIPLQSGTWPEAKPGKKRAKGSEIEGVWTQAFDENQGRLRCFLPGAIHPDPFASPDARLWKISKDIIEIGPDNKLFPQHRWSYQLNPENKPGAMNIIPLNKDGEKRPDIWLGIYYLRDDYLMINLSIEALRPEKFTTTAMPNTTWLYVLRRGKLK